MSTETGAWMPMYWGDYFGDTMHLTTEEHGAYLLLIGTYWQRAKPLPDDDKWLASASKLSTKKWKMVRPKIADFFDISDGEWIHKRIIKEALKSSNRLVSARAAGKAGGLAKSKLSTTTTTKKKETALLGGKEKPPAEPAPPIQESTEDDKPTKPKPAKRGTGIPKNWEPDSTAIAFAQKRGFNILQIEALGIAFASHHAAKGTASKDWSASWRVWVLRDLNFHGPPEARGVKHGGPGQSRKGFAAISSEVALEFTERAERAGLGQVDGNGTGEGPGSGGDVDPVHDGSGDGGPDNQGTQQTERDHETPGGG